MRRIPGARRARAAAGRLRAEIRERLWRRRLHCRDATTLKKLRGRTDLRLNVGSSSHHLDGWISIDIRPDGEIFAMDATLPWPFEAGSAEAINSEHFIEHCSLDEAGAYFREAFRALRQGGVIRTSTPDLRGLTEAYLEAHPDTLQIHRSHGYGAHDHGEMLNNYFYCWGHRHIHDFASLERLLAEAGFEQITQASFNKSKHPTLDGIDCHDPEGLEATILCVDAVKPA